MSSDKYGAHLDNHLNQLAINLFMTSSKPTGLVSKSLLSYYSLCKFIAFVPNKGTEAVIFLKRLAKLDFYSVKKCFLVAGRQLFQKRHQKLAPVTLNRSV